MLVTAGPRLRRISSDTFPIVNVTGSSIEVKSKEDTIPEEFPGRVHGWTDRITGIITLSSEHRLSAANDESMLLEYDFNCKRANPVF